MYYGAIKKYDIANGPGVRVSLFVSGCEHYCKGCFNSEAWDFSYGNEFNYKTRDELFTALNAKYIRGLTILGGEPMHPQNQLQILDILKDFKFIYDESDKDLWIYTGYLYEDLVSNKIGKYSEEILKYTDVLVDGPFIQDLKDIGLNFRGSRNQRIIDVQKSISSGEVILHPLGIGDSDKYIKKEK